ncbi:MAG: hypothetical protein LBD24_06005 [Spirochaetaceae bacterium]|jgi:cysteine sulfinate desulfinase/cysteine desulfurase-like protein|nr:hypothetical protein [Spirochaetaceae bacterium]
MFLTALGYDEALSRSALRVSLSHDNTEEEIAVLNRELPRIIAALRPQPPAVS